MKPATPRQQKLAAAYDADIWPLLPERAAEAILRQVPRIPAAQVLEVGTATGKLALDVAGRLDGASHVLGVDGSPAFIALAEAARAGHESGKKVSFRVSEAIPEGPFDVVLCNLTLAEAQAPEAAVVDLVGSLKPGGRLVMTLPLRGSWTEFLDLYADVLTEQGKREGLAALRAYRANLPDADAAVTWLEGAGLIDVAVEVDRWELLFKSAREFFFAPIIEMGPLPTWKLIAGGHGDEMQDVFFFVKEAIETYFAGEVFPVSVVIGCLRGTKASAPGVT
jgi:SAM-dependent methyltransferase